MTPSWSSIAPYISAEEQKISTMEEEKMSNLKLVHTYGIGQLHLPAANVIRCTPFIILLYDEHQNERIRKPLRTTLGAISCLTVSSTPS